MASSSPGSSSRNPRRPKVPVILATAHAMFGDRERFISETGAEHYISKPIHDPDLFLGEVRRILPLQA